MITDPDDPDIRYPQPGERLLHRPSQQWVEVTPFAPGWCNADSGEVAVRIVATGELATVKLRSLEEVPR